MTDDDMDELEKIEDSTKLAARGEGERRGGKTGHFNKNVRHRINRHSRTWASLKRRKPRPITLPRTGGEHD